MSRESLKSRLAALSRSTPSAGAILLIYHRVGGESVDERDVSVAAFAEQLDVAQHAGVVSLDVALDRLERRDPTPGVVLTFDDGFGDVYANAWPLLRDRSIPFVVYLAAAHVGGRMEWEGSTAKASSVGLEWDELREMVESGLCTLGNHTYTHARPATLTTDELDLCDEAVERHIGVRPRHFAYPWGIEVPALTDEIRGRFRSAATGRLGRNRPGADLHRLRRVPVRRTDPIVFFRAKLEGNLWPERTYGAMVRVAKALGASA